MDFGDAANIGYALPAAWKTVLRSRIPLEPFVFYMQPTRGQISPISARNYEAIDDMICSFAFAVGKIIILLIDHEGNPLRLPASLSTTPSGEITSPNLWSASIGMGHRMAQHATIPMAIRCRRKALFPLMVFQVPMSPDV